MQPSPAEQEATKRAKRSRSRGRGFETQLLKTLWALGYTRAKRMVLSGANLDKPYDVIVPPFRLKIEAKRRGGDAIILDDKWLRRISKKYIVAFATGARLSATNKIQSISLAVNHDDLYRVEMQKNKTIGTEDGKFVVGRTKAQGGDLVITGSFCIMHAGRRLLVQDFEHYMKTNWHVTMPVVAEPEGETDDA